MNGLIPTRHSGRSAIRRRSGEIVAIILSLGACGGDGGDVSSEPAVGDGDASSEIPAYCYIVLGMEAIDFTSPTAVIEAYVLNGQYVVALVEEGPEQADELLGDMVELAERVGDMDPATLEPAVELFPFDDPNDPALDGLDPEVRQDADDLIAFQTGLNASDPAAGEELEEIVEGECASVVATTELPATDPDE